MIAPYLCQVGRLALIICAVALSGSAVQAQTLGERLTEMLKVHERLKASEADLEAARNRVRVALGDWFPDLDLTAHYGHEKQRKDAAANTELPTREFDIKITQLLWDFGATNAALRRVRLAFEQAQIGLASTRQSLILEGVTAYLNLFRAVEVLGFARQSEANIVRQTELESAMVKRGAGFSTDVLQAKTQLAGAQARRVRAEGGLRIAINRYRAVFKAEPGELMALVRPRLPIDRLPKSMDDIVSISHENNLSLRLARIGAQVARETVTNTRSSEFFPKLEGILEAKWKQDVAGTKGFKGEQLAKVELSFPFNLGFTAVNTLRAAEGGLAAAEDRLADSVDLIEEQARNAWQRLETSKANADFLRNQANIAGEFLDLARKERKLGRRSLLDVLNGETSLINANSDTASADTDVAIAIFTLLSVMGQLELDIIG